jgi:outer membrane protein TolC
MYSELVHDGGPVMSCLPNNASADHYISLQLYNEGQTDFLNVLAAQLALYADENALTLSRQAIATDLIALYKALGGGWG